MQELLPRVRLEAGAQLPAGRLWLEIGFGGGEHLAWQAARNPDATLIGCEVYRNGIATLLAQIDREGLGNIRIWPEDARDLIDRLPEASIERAFLLFPDPWPKARHAERRFVAGTNIDALARILKPGAELRVATDDPIYLRWTLELLPMHPAFRWLIAGPADWRRRPPDWPATRYERKALAAGRKPAYLRFSRI